MYNINNFDRLESLINAKAQNLADTFRRSAAYFLVTGRKGLTVFESDEAFLITAIHPHDSSTTLLFPEIGGDFSLTAKLLANGNLGSGSIRCARFMSEEIIALERRVSEMFSGNLFSFDNAHDHTMDWNYPCHILSTERTAKLSGAKYERVRNKFNKASQAIEVLPYTSSTFTNAMKASTYSWISNLVWQGIDGAETYKEFYDALLHNIKSNPTAYDGFMVLKEGEPCGFTIWDKIQGDTANAIASLSKRSVKGMSEFQTVTACLLLADQGVKFYNLGGSETGSLDKHKREYLPETSISLSAYDVTRMPFASEKITKYNII